MPPTKDLQTTDIRGVEVLRTGKWHGTNCPAEGCEFTAQDLDRMVQASAETEGQHDSPVKLGHDKDQKLLQQDGYPSAGWVRNLRRVGERLVADFVKVPQRISDLIQAGALAKRSVEISRDFEIDGKSWPLVLTGVALLGADLPAVNGLKDIEKLYQGMGYAPEANDYYFEAEDPDATFEDPNDPKTKVASIKARLRELRADAESLIKGRKGTPVLRALFRDVEETIDRIAAGRSFSKGDEMKLSEATLKLLGLDADADEAAVEAAIAKAVGDGGGDDGGDDGGGDSDAVKALRSELDEQSKTIVQLQSDAAKSKAETLVDNAIQEGRIFPKSRDVMVKMALRDYDEAAEFIASQGKVVDTSEHGREGGLEGDALLASVEPTKDQIAVMTQQGTDTPEQRVELMRLNAVTQGVELPSGWEKKYLPEDKGDAD